MDPPEMVPTEEAVEALINALVSPILPRSGISWNFPTPEQQEAVAKQIYAVVLLYNYYHRKLFPKLEFLDFISFCKVACISKPDLLKYMNALYKSHMSSGNLDEPLSITERMIMDACNISSALDVAKDATGMEGWPISKVAVFLVDPSKEHCLLRSSGSTQAIKSLVEKDLEMPLGNVALVPEMKNVFGSKTNPSGSSKENFNGMEDIMQKVAFSAVEEEMGISHSNLSILGCHLSYSLSHLKSTTRLYIMSYAEPIDNQIPVKAVMQSLQGPLVKFNSAPEVTAVIGYYSLLPYIDILSDWLSRETSHSASQHTLTQKTDVDKKGSEGIIIIDIHEVSDDSGCSHENMDNCSSKTCTNAETISKNENKSSLEVISVRSENAAISSFTKKAVLSTVKEEADEDDFPALIDQSWDTSISKKRKVKNVLAESFGASYKYNSDDSSTEHYLKTLDRDRDTNLDNVISHNLVNNAKSLLNQVGGAMNNMMEKPNFLLEANVIDATQMHQDGDGAKDGDTRLQVRRRPFTRSQTNVTSPMVNSNNHDPHGLSEKVDMMSVLKMLKRKRDELCQQQRLLEDNIALCEMSIQTVLSGKETSALKVENMLKTCEFLYSNEMKDENFSTEAQCQPQTISRKKLYEAVLHLRSPCQELDEIFCANDWILPKYCVVPSTDGKFQAVVRVQGMDFECDCNGDLKSSPREARESAAAHILSKLRGMAAQA